MDIMAFGAHPDDCEISVGGTLAAMKKKGYKVGICDLTRGEAATYGSVAIREAELRQATEILGLDARVTLDLPDGDLRDTEENRLKVVDVIRARRPEIVLTFVETTRHPDHAHCGELVKNAAFVAGLEKIKTNHQPFMPSQIIRFPEFTWKEPDFVVDITDFWHIKEKAVRAYASQIIGEGEDDRGTKTFVRSHAFWEMIEARSRYAGGLIGVKYAEPFFANGPVPIDDIIKTFTRK